MKTKSLWLSSRGFSMAEITIAVAIMGMLSLWMAQMTGNSVKGSKTTEQKMDMLTEQMEMKQLLTSVESCSVTFGGQLVTGLPRTVSTIIRSVKGVQTTKWTTNTLSSKKDLKLTSVTMTSYTGDIDNALTGDLNVDVKWEKIGKYFGPQYVTDSVHLSVTINSSNVIQDCKASLGSGSADNLWQVHANGIYYNDTTSPIVNIGSYPDISSPALLQVQGAAVIGLNASITSTTSVALGGSSTALYSVAIGERSKSSAQGAIAIGGTSVVGSETTASGVGAIAIGSANTWNPSATAARNVGPIASGAGAIAIGSAGDDPTQAYWSLGGPQTEGAVASGDWAIALGTRAGAYEDQSLAMGLAAMTGNAWDGLGNRPRGVAIGPWAMANDSETVAIGYGAKGGQLGNLDGNTDNGKSIAIGSASQALDLYGIALGQLSNAGQPGEGVLAGEGDYAISIGYQSYAYDSQSIAIGAAAVAGDSALNAEVSNGVAIGASSAVKGGNNLALGTSANMLSGGGTAVGNYAYAGTGILGAMAIGDNATSRKQFSYAIGPYSETDCDHGVAIGTTAHAITAGAQTGAIAIGSSAYASGSGVAIGFNSNVGKDGVAVAIGKNATVTGNGSLALGGKISTNNATSDIVIGAGANISTALSYYSMVIAPDTADTIDAPISYQFTAHFANGYKFCAGATGTAATACLTGFEILDNGTTAALSDVNLKQDLELVDAEKFVDKFLDLDIFWWNYISAPESEFRQIGPMAQDFKRTFGTFGDDKHIKQLDADGVIMAGIKGMAIKNKKLEERIEQLDYETPELNERFDKLETALVEKLDH